MWSVGVKSSNEQCALWVASVSQCTRTIFNSVNTNLTYTIRHQRLNVASTVATFTYCCTRCAHTFRPGGQSDPTKTVHCHCQFAKLLSVAERVSSKTLVLVLLDLAGLSEGHQLVITLLPADWWGRAGRYLVCRLQGAERLEARSKISAKSRVGKAHHTLSSNKGQACSVHEKHDRA